MLPKPFPADAFGDRFDLSKLPLPRAPAGYAVQRLDTDQVLDRRSGELLPVRSPNLEALFTSFDDAHAAACLWDSGIVQPHVEVALRIISGSEPVFVKTYS